MPVVAATAANRCGCWCWATSAAARRQNGRRLSSRPTQRVDVDTLDDVIRRLGPRLDRAGRRDPLRADRRLSPRPVVRPARVVQGPARGARHTAGGSDDELGRLLGKAAAPPATPASRREWTRRVDPRTSSLRTSSRTRRRRRRRMSTAVDSAIAEQMRALLHDAGVPVARSGLARRALAGLEPGARREPAAASVRRVARRAARRCRRGAGPARADRPLSGARRSLAQRAGRPGLVGHRRADPVRSVGRRHRAARRARADRVAGRRAAAWWRGPGAGW